MWAERAAAKIDRDYWKAIDKMNELKDSMDEAQRRYNARQEGLQEGRAEGIGIGIEEGKESVARNALAKGLTPELICSITGLDMETIKSL